MGDEKDNEKMINMYSRKFENNLTKESIRYDYGDFTSYGFDDEDHYHRYNHNAPKGRMGDCIRFLDCEGNPVARGDERSNLHPPEGVTWKR